MKATCLTPKCGKSNYARGLCSPCYSKAWRAGTIQLELPLGRHTLTEVDKVGLQATCSICGPVAIEVRQDRGGKIRLQCSTARRLQRGRGTPQARRRARLREKYRITPETVEELMRAQDGRCAICAAEPEEGLNIDHDHSNGLVRGLLCRGCNVGLGHFKDNPDLLAGAMAYLTSPPAQL